MRIFPTTSPSPSEPPTSHSPHCNFVVTYSEEALQYMSETTILAMAEFIASNQGAAVCRPINQESKPLLESGSAAPKEMVTKTKSSVNLLTSGFITYMAAASGKIPQGQLKKYQDLSEKEVANGEKEIARAELESKRISKIEPENEELRNELREFSDEFCNKSYTTLVDHQVYNGTKREELFCFIPNLNENQQNQEGELEIRSESGQILHLLKDERQGLMPDGEHPPLHAIKQQVRGGDGSIEEKFLFFDPEYKIHPDNHGKSEEEKTKFFESPTLLEKISATTAAKVKVLAYQRFEMRDDKIVKTDPKPVTADVDLLSLGFCNHFSDLTNDSGLNAKELAKQEFNKTLERLNAVEFRSSSIGYAFEKDWVFIVALGKDVYQTVNHAAESTNKSPESFCDGDFIAIDPTGHCKVLKSRQEVCDFFNEMSDQGISLPNNEWFHLDEKTQKLVLLDKNASIAWGDMREELGRIAAAELLLEDGNKQEFNFATIESKVKELRSKEIQSSDGKMLLDQDASPISTVNFERYLYEKYKKYDLVQTSSLLKYSRKDFDGDVSVLDDIDNNYTKVRTAYLDETLAELFCDIDIFIKMNKSSRPIIAKYSPAIYEKLDELHSDKRNKGKAPGPELVQIDSTEENRPKSSDSGEVIANGVLNPAAPVNNDILPHQENSMMQTSPSRSPSLPQRAGVSFQSFINKLCCCFRS